MSKKFAFFAVAKLRKKMALHVVNNVIGSKKTTVGYGLLLIDMGKDLSISLLATGEMKQ